jgi:hypothetical protein
MNSFQPERADTGRNERSSIDEVPSPDVPGVRPDLDQLKRQAKALLVTLREREPGKPYALHDAQFALAREYGFDTWPKLKAFVEGVRERRLAEAVRSGELAQVRSMLHARPELARRGGPLHIAVMQRAPEIVRVLMEHGANPREGVYPHRDATSL